MSISEFLEARIAEDEAAANHRDTVTFGPERRKFANDATRDPHDPARVLAECAAKRALMNLYKWGPECEVFDGANWTNPLEVLAAVYADHPDYQQEWAD